MTFNPMERRQLKREVNLALGRAKVALHNIGIKIAGTPRGNQRLPRLRRRACQLIYVVGRREGCRQLSFSRKEG
jgi:hypothetical protein